MARSSRSAVALQVVPLSLVQVPSARLVVKSVDLTWVERETATLPVWSWVRSLADHVGEGRVVGGVRVVAVVVRSVVGAGWDDARNWRDVGHGGHRAGRYGRGVHDRLGLGLG